MGSCVARWISRRQSRMTALSQCVAPQGGIQGRGGIQGEAFREAFRDVVAIYFPWIILRSIIDIWPTIPLRFGPMPRRARHRQQAVCYHVDNRGAGQTQGIRSDDINRT